MVAPYTPQGIVRARNRDRVPHPGVHKRKGWPVTSRYRQIMLRVPTKQYNDWLRASAAIEHRDLRLWLIFLADREAEASINPS